jgi:hypothetical protein
VDRRLLLLAEEAHLDVGVEHAVRVRRRQVPRLVDVEPHGEGPHRRALLEQARLVPGELGVDGVLAEAEAELEQHRAGVRGEVDAAHLPRAARVRPELEPLRVAAELGLEELGRGHAAVADGHDLGRAPLEVDADVRELVDQYR